MAFTLRTPDNELALQKWEVGQGAGDLSAGTLPRRGNKLVEFGKPGMRVLMKCEDGAR